MLRLGHGSSGAPAALPSNPLIEIDHYGERLIGCIEWNRWSWPDSKRLFMALPDEDLQALKTTIKRACKKPRWGIGVHSGASCVAGSIDRKGLVVGGLSLTLNSRAGAQVPN